MSEIITIITIGIALSMDTFSLSLSLGMLKIDIRKQIAISILIGFFHFFMPLIGMHIGEEIFEHLNINYNFLIGIILIFLAFSMLIEIIKCEEPKINLSSFGLTFLAFSVSFDSLGAGIGLLAVTEKIYFSTIFFAVCAGLFTLLGIIVGKYGAKILGTYSKIIGIILLIGVGVTYLCQAI